MTLLRGIRSDRKMLVELKCNQEKQCKLQFDRGKNEYRQNAYFLFNQTCLIKRLLPDYKYFKIHDPAADYGVRDNFGKFIKQLQSETKALFRKLERILIKLY